MEIRDCQIKSHLLHIEVKDKSVTRIFYIVSTLKCSGPTNQLYSLIKYLDRSQFEPHLVTLSSEPADSRWKDYEALGVQLHSLNLSRIAGLFLARWRLQSLIEQIVPDLVHTQGIRADMLSAYLPLGIPKICTVRNIPQEDYSMTYGAFRAALMTRRHTSAMRKLSRCVGVSRAVTENLSTAFSVQNSTTIQNGVDTEIYCPASNEQKAAFRNKLVLPKQGKLWLVSGHLSSRKAPLFLIEAWKQKFTGDPLNHLVFIGDGPLMSQCKAALLGQDNIHILGRVSDVSSYLKACDFFISTSKAEGLPNAVLEAMACGLPVLLSDIGPHKEIWDMSPSIGALFSLGDKEAFNVCINYFARRDYQAMSDAAIRLIDDRLSAQKMSGGYQRLYSELAGSGR